MWDRRFLKLAYEVAGWSKDPSTKVGAVIVGNRRRVVSLGYNGMPRGVNDEVSARLERPEKYAWFEHAERNAIYNAAEPLVGCIMYSTLIPCADCARGIVQVGIREVVVAEDTETNRVRWTDSWRVAREMFQEVGIVLRSVRMEGSEVV